jgi:hypothetical protein
MIVQKKRKIRKMDKITLIMLLAFFAISNKAYSQPKLCKVENNNDYLGEYAGLSTESQASIIINKDNRFIFTQKKHQSGMFTFCAGTYIIKDSMLNLNSRAVVNKFEIKAWERRNKKRIFFTRKIINNFYRIEDGCLIFKEGESKIVRH